MMTTKKFCDAYKEEGICDIKSREFVIPNFIDSKNQFIGIKTGKKSTYGMVVFTGVDLDSSKVIKKIEEFNAVRIKNLDVANKILNDYLNVLKDSRIGQILEVINDGKNVIASKIKRKVNKIKLPS